MNEIIDKIFTMRTAAWKRFGPFGEAPILYLGRKQMEQIRELPLADLLQFTSRSQDGEFVLLGMSTCEVDREDHLNLGLPQV